MTSVHGHAGKVLHAAVPVLVSLGLIVAGCSTPQALKPVAAIDGEPLELAGDAPYERAKDFLREGRLGLAIQDFRAALAQQPGSVMALNGLAITYDQLGRSDLAERYFHRALALQPDSAETLNNLGYSALRRGQVGRARAAFEAAQSLAPHDGVVLANLDLLRQSDSPLSVAAQLPPAADDNPSAFTSLVARVDFATQMLLTHPDPQLTALAIAHGVQPALFALPAVRPTDRAKDRVPH